MLFNGAFLTSIKARRTGCNEIIISEIDKDLEGGCCSLYQSNIPVTLSIHLPEETEENNNRGKMYPNH
jgi:hypothetical protein